MNEDDTFNKLKRSPFSDVINDYMNCKLGTELDEILQRHNWSKDEFTPAYNAHIRECIKVITETTTFKNLPK